MFRTALATTSIAPRRLVATRAFHATPAASKSAVDQVKDAAKTVNKKVGEALAAGIDKGEEATEKTKEAVGSSAEKADAKKNQAAAGAREAKDDFKKEVNKPA